MGADLLVADELCAKAFSIQVKTNGNPARFWLVGVKAQRVVSPHHYYVFVNLRSADNRHEYFIVSSTVVAKKMRVNPRKNSIWYAFYKQGADEYRDKWDAFDLCEGEQLSQPLQPA